MVNGATLCQPQAAVALSFGPVAAVLVPRRGAPTAGRRPQRPLQDFYPIHLWVGARGTLDPPATGSSKRLPYVAYNRHTVTMAGFCGFAPGRKRNTNSHRECNGAPNDPTVTTWRRGVTVAVTVGNRLGLADFLGLLRCDG
jgi:hypothetical protein